MCKTATVDTTEQRRRLGWTTENSEALSRPLVESTRLWLLSSSTGLGIRYYVVEAVGESSSSIPERLPLGAQVG